MECLPFLANAADFGREVNDGIIRGGNTESSAYGSKDVLASTSVISSSPSSSSSSSSGSNSSSSESSSEDGDDSTADITYMPEEYSASDSDFNAQDKDPAVDTSLTGKDNAILSSPIKRGVKRKRNVGKWRRNILKHARNSGKEYEMRRKDKKVREERIMKPACSDKCRLSCSTKFSEEDRLKLFSEYWELGNIDKQREFIKSGMQEIKPSYKYVRVGGKRPPRRNNMAFYFHQNDKRIRVCKLFFMNTLDINSRPIRTVVEKQNKVANVLMEGDKRGKHGNQPKIKESVKVGIREFIDSIPKIESHYTRANTSKHFIDGVRPSQIFTKIMWYTVEIKMLSM